MVLYKDKIAYKNTKSKQPNITTPVQYQGIPNLQNSNGAAYICI